MEGLIGSNKLSKAVFDGDVKLNDTSQAKFEKNFGGEIRQQENVDIFYSHFDKNAHKYILLTRNQQ